MNMQVTGQTIAAPRPTLSPTDLSMPRSKGIVVGFWIVTAPLPADGLHRLRAAAPAAGGGDVHAPRLPRLLPGGAVVGEAPRRSAAACAGAGAAQRICLRRLRHHPRLGARCALLGGRWSGSVELGGGHRRAVGAVVLLLAPPAGHAGERLTARWAQPFRDWPAAQMNSPNLELP